MASKMFRRHVPHLPASASGVSSCPVAAWPQVEVLQLPLGISHGGVGIQRCTAGALQPPSAQAASLHGGQLGHDLVIASGSS